ncbi:MAG TPA: hypothetical protein VK699_05960 [Terriglobales bacterium]|jgi:hypothetical protein|nr:hypothetical protein [Terriglobales bacterium]
MSPEDQDAAIGRVVRERRELQIRLAALESEAGNLGVVLANLGALLQARPEDVVFENHPAPAELLGRAPVFKQGDVLASRVIHIVDEIRKAKFALSNIETKAAHLGI